MPTVLTALWVLAMVLYMGTAIYLELFAKDRCSRKLSGAFMAIGAAIFIAINRRIFIFGDSGMFWTELLIILLMVIGWYLAWKVVSFQIEHHDLLSDARR